MPEPRYGWKGWKAPLLHPGDPEYCEQGCPVCRSARRGNRIAKTLQALETWLTFGGCWWGRARRRKYGVSPGQPIPDHTPASLEGPHDGPGAAT